MKANHLIRVALLAGSVITSCLSGNVFAAANPMHTAGVAGVIKQGGSGGLGGNNVRFSETPPSKPAKSLCADPSVIAEEPCGLATGGLHIYGRKPLHSQAPTSITSLGGCDPGACEPRVGGDRKKHIFIGPITGPEGCDPGPCISESDLMTGDTRKEPIVFGQVGTTSPHTSHFPYGSVGITDG